MSSSENEERKDSVTSGQLLEPEEEDHHKELSGSSLKKILFFCSFAFMMNYAAYGGLVFLQSSMNIENGLGTASLFAIFATSALSTIFFVPFFIDFMGAKAAIVIGELGITAFTIANFYPSWYTMIPVAIFHGLTESSSWAGAAVYVAYLGEKYWERKRKSKSLSKSNKSEEHYVYRFFSIFFVFVYFAQVVGNTLVCLVLSGLKDWNVNDDRNYSSVALHSGNVSTFSNATELNRVDLTASNIESWDQCGVNECQSEYIYDKESEQLKKYEPNQVSVYLLLGIFLFIQITFTLVHAIVIPKIPAKFDSVRPKRKAIKSNRDDPESMLKELSHHSGRFETAVRSELKETYRHFVSPLHVLVFPLIFYYGSFLAFNVTEFTRAYVSCTIGVEQVGLVAVMYGASSMCTSLLSTKLLPLLGRNIVFSVVGVMHMSAYLMCLLWQPSPDSWFMIYVISASLGCCDGTCTNAMQGMIAIYFQDRLGIAFSVKNFASNLGIVVGTGISTFLCMHVKIYTLMTFAVISAVSYVGAELLYRRTKHTDSKSVS